MYPSFHFFYKIDKCTFGGNPYFEKQIFLRNYLVESTHWVLSILRRSLHSPFKHNFPRLSLCLQDLLEYLSTSGVCLHWLPFSLPSRGISVWLLVMLTETLIRVPSPTQNINQTLSVLQCLVFLGSTFSLIKQFPVLSLVYYHSSAYIYTVVVLQCLSNLSRTLKGCQFPIHYTWFNKF